LNTLANFDWIDFTRVKWNTCSDDSGADCLTPKGFTFMRVIVSEGVYIDFYNLHADAGYISTSQISYLTYPNSSLVPILATKLHVQPISSKSLTTSTPGQSATPSSFSATPTRDTPVQQME
jgi:hypothetical protein